MRPIKTNFGLSFGHFGGSYVKGEEEEEEEKKKRRRRGSQERYEYMTLSMESMYGIL